MSAKSLTIVLKYEVNYLEFLDSFYSYLIDEYIDHLKEQEWGGALYRIAGDLPSLKAIPRFDYIQHQKIKDLITYGKAFLIGNERDFKHKVLRQNKKLFKMSYDETRSKAQELIWSLKPPQAVWGMLKSQIKEFCNNHFTISQLQSEGWSSENMEYFFENYRWNDILNTNQNQQEICYSCGSCKDISCITEKQFNRIRTQLRNWFDTLIRRLVKFEKVIKIQKKNELTKDKAEEMINKFIFDRMMNTDYKIGRHFFNFRLKQDGLEYE